MKKIITVIFCIVCILLVLIYVKYKNYKSEQRIVKEQNLEYEEYKNKEILGSELTSLINKAVNNNEKNKVSKDEQGFYIQNETNSIEIEIKITDNDSIYKMETFYNGGMVTFVQYYDTIYFECTKINYNSKGRVGYMLFEQKTN